MDFIEKIRQAVKIPTWWPSGAHTGDKAAEAPLLDFQKLLEDQFPAFHTAAERWVLSPYSVIYRLKGTENNENKAALFIAHYDVVPVEAEKWSVKPFDAEIKDGYIYGRGTLDVKSVLISIMEAAEKLCEQNWKPKNDIWFAFGGDEERSGTLGAVKTVEWFNNRVQRFAWLLDEGTPISENFLSGINTPLALVSIAEKGYLSLKLSVTQAPGHSSRPPKVQAAAVLGRALVKISKKNFPYRLTAAAEMFFREISPLIPGMRGFVMRHARILGPLFFKIAASNPAITAMLRTTIAMTQLAGSSADNVLPSEVSAIINLRLLEPWTKETALEFIKKIINDKRVNVNIHKHASNPTPPAKDYRLNGWSEINIAINEAWPNIPVMPFIMVATTDSRHYKTVADNIFRFNPYKLNSKEQSGVHGHDERISIENLNQGLIFYTRLLKEL